MTRQYNHYFKNVQYLKFIDVYRVLKLFGVSDPCIQHAIKKLLVAGLRGHKDISKDVDEAIVSLNRWKEMREEDEEEGEDIHYTDMLSSHNIIPTYTTTRYVNQQSENISNEDDNKDINIQQHTSKAQEIYDLIKSKTQKK